MPRGSSRSGSDNCEELNAGGNNSGKNIDN
jgi:hypothetical protein